MENTKWVYLFNEANIALSANGGKEKILTLMGGKGANLAEMSHLGLPVPQGFTITTEACNSYLADDNRSPDGLWEQVLDAMGQLEKETGKEFGSPENPLFVSSRSGAKDSMPGMMDTVLNIGLNDETTAGLAKQTGDSRFAYDAYRRLIQMFSCVVMNLPDEAFEQIIDKWKVNAGVENDNELAAEDWQEIVKEFKGQVLDFYGKEFPQDPYDQLKMSMEGVFESWNGKRAVDYRNAAGISHDLGTAVSIVTMVFGNMGEDSGTGVAFTRDPATGEKRLYGDYLINAQGEDVVAGIRNTTPIAQLEKEMPAVFKEFIKVTQILESHYRDIQDVEFTIEEGKLWMLQTRNGKRTANAGVKIAVDMVAEGLISKDEAVSRILPEQVDVLLHPQFSEEIEGVLFCKGVNASPGAAVGQVYFDADTAQRMAEENGLDVILARPFTKPDDIHGMLAAKGLLTSEGGATSHAAVVARQFGVPCVVGARGLRIDLDNRQMTINGHVVKEGDWLSVNGTTGEVYLGQLPTEAPVLDDQKDLLTLLGWADEIAARPGSRSDSNGRTLPGLKVWANADYPDDAARARRYGAQGIGLCRTEHMFFETDRLPIVQRMILSETTEGRKAALDELLPFQREDFAGLFEAMDGLPVIIRLIDPPLHEFLPSQEELVKEVAVMKALEQTEGLDEKQDLLKKVRNMHESNPMMGMRGVRLSIMMPEIVEMQVRAIFEAAADVALKGFKPIPEVMVPLTGHINELKFIQPRLERIAKEVMEEKEINFTYKFGTMIEIPRAALTAVEIAEMTDFFSFGTNDLTQMTFGYSRDDAEGNYLMKYVEDGILPSNPFQTIDQEGVGRLMQMTVEDGRKTRPDLEVGICGEHGGDPESIRFCHKIGLDYVSCSPYRVPVARLAAAHAALEVT